MRIYPAVHYTMGGLWVDYDLMNNVPGLFVIGEAKQTFRTTAPTVSGPAASCKVWQMVISSCRTRCRITWPARWENGRRRILRSFSESRKVFAPGLKSSSTSTALAQSTRSIENWPASFGGIAGCLRHGLREALEFELREQFWHEVREYRATATISISPWNAPDALPNSWNSPS